MPTTPPSTPSALPAPDPTIAAVGSPPPVSGASTAHVLGAMRGMPDAAAQFRQYEPYLRAHGVDTGHIQRTLDALAHYQQSPGSFLGDERKLAAQGLDTGFITSHLPGGFAYEQAHGAPREPWYDRIVPAAAIQRGAQAVEKYAEPAAAAIARTPLAPPWLQHAEEKFAAGLVSPAAEIAQPIAHPREPLGQRLLHAGAGAAGVAADIGAPEAAGDLAGAVRVLARGAAPELLSGAGDVIAPGLTRRAAGQVLGRLGGGVAGGIAAPATARRLGAGPGGQLAAGLAGAVGGSLAGGAAAGALGAPLPEAFRRAGPVRTGEQLPEPEARPAAAGSAPAPRPRLLGPRVFLSPSEYPVPAGPDLEAASRAARLAGVAPPSRYEGPVEVLRRGPVPDRYAIRTPRPITGRRLSAGAPVRRAPLGLPPGAASGRSFAAGPSGVRVVPPPPEVNPAAAAPPSGRFEVTRRPGSRRLAEIAAQRRPAGRTAAPAVPDLPADLAAATAPVQPNAPRPSGPGASATTVAMPGASAVPARYEILDLSRLTPSHNPANFAPSPGYPQSVQERRYDASREAQSRVLARAAQFDPRFLLTDTPDAVNGPPVVDSRGIVLGGNGRTMSLARVYAAGRGEPYRQALAAAAPRFGLSPQKALRLRQPVLVRVAEGPLAQSAASAAGTGMNRSFTGAMSPNELAASRGKLVGHATLGRIAAAMEHDPSLTLREVLERDGARIAQGLEADGVITPEERPALVDEKSGSLTRAGKDFAERALLGAAVPDQRALDAAPAAALQKVAAGLNALGYLRQRGKWDLTAPLGQALELRGEAAARGLPLDDLLRQQELTGPRQLDPRAVTLAEAMGGPAKDFRAALRAYAADAAAAGAEGQQMLPGVPVPDAAEAFEAAFSGRPAFSLAADFTQSGRRAAKARALRAAVALEQANDYGAAIELRQLARFGQWGAVPNANVRGAAKAFRRYEASIERAIAAIGEDDAATLAGSPRRDLDEEPRRVQGSFSFSAEGDAARAPLHQRPLTAAEAMPSLPSPLYRDPESGAILMSGAGRAILRPILRAHGVRTPLDGFRADVRGVRAIRRALIAAGWPSLAAELPASGAAAFGMHGLPNTRRIIAEELAHMRQADADADDADESLSPPEALAFLRLVPTAAVRGMLGRYHNEMARVVHDKQRSSAAAQNLAAEIGVRLLIGDYADLGLNQKAGDALAREYIQGVERTWPNGWKKLFETHGHGTPGGGPTGGFSLAASRGEGGEPPAGGDDYPVSQRGQGAHSLGQNEAAAGPERPGPSHEPAFHLAATAGHGASVASTVAQIYHSLGRYPGVSDEARGDLRLYDAGREVRAVSAKRLAHSLYGLIAQKLGPDYQADLPQLLKIQSSIVRPAEPRYSLTEPQREVRSALIEARDAITAHDIARGWMTPEAYDGDPREAAQALPEVARQPYLDALAAWTAAKDAAFADYHARNGAAGRMGFLRAVVGEPPSPARAIRDYLAAGGTVNAPASLDPDARALLRAWINDARQGAPQPYWPGSYSDDRETVRKILQPREAGRGGRLRQRPNAMQPKVYPDFVAAEAKGLHQNPDAVAVLTKRLDDSLGAADAENLLRRLGQLGPAEVRQADIEPNRGEMTPVVEPGMRLARNLDSLGSALKLRALGGENTLVSRPLAEAIDTAIGLPKAPEGPLAGLRQAVGRAGRAAWVAQRAIQFYNILKHPVNIWANAAMEGYVGGTKALARGDLAAAASHARAAAGPLAFLLDPEVMQGVREESGELFDRALKAGAVRTHAGQAGSFGTEETPRVEAAVAEARRDVFGASGETGFQRVRRVASQLANLGHSAVFRFFDLGVRLKMFKEALAQGLDDRQAADRVNTYLVNYADVGRRGFASLMNRIFYTLPWMKGNAAAQIAAWRENPIAMLLAAGALLGAMEWENRRVTGHAMAANPPGLSDRAAIGRAPNGQMRFATPTLPQTMLEQAATHPDEFVYNRLDPSIRALFSVGANQRYPPAGLPNLVTGAQPGGSPVVTDAERAAAAAGDRGPMLAAIERQATGEALRGPWSDYTRIVSGSAPASQLVLPYSAREYWPEEALYGDAQNARSLAAKLASAERLGQPAQRWRTALLATIRSSRRDIGAEAAHLQAMPPGAARARELRRAEGDWRELEGAARHLAR